jgi:hypothetical protein
MNGFGMGERDCHSLFSREAVLSAAYEDDFKRVLWGDVGAES